MRIHAICNQKGGSGKSALAVNLAAALASLGEKILVIDMDPQASATARLGLNPDEDEGASWEQLLLKGEGDLAALCQKTSVEGVEIVPAGIKMERAEKSLMNEIGFEHCLDRLIKSLPPDRYDRVLIDTRPSLGTYTLISLVAAHNVLFPVVMSRDAVAGTSNLLDLMALVKGRLNPGIYLLGIIACSVQKGPTMDRQILIWLEENYGKYLFENQISQSVVMRDSESQMKPVTTIFPSHKVSQQFFRLASELREREARYV